MVVFLLHIGEEIVLLVWYKGNRRRKVMFAHILFTTSLIYKLYILYQIDQKNACE